MVDTFPMKEKYGLTDQLRRAVISIPSNIAEGLGRSTHKDKGHFMQIGSFGSSRYRMRCRVYIYRAISENGTTDS